MGKESKIGYVCDDFTTIKLKSVLLKNDAGDWGSNPDENAIGIIRSTNFNNNGILDLTDVAYRTLSPKKKEEKKLYVGDILIERSGGSDTQPVGRVGLITEHMLNEDFAFANFIQRISVKKDILLPQYLYYCLQQMYEMGITASMQAQTTGIRNLDWKQYVKTILPKPSLSEQTAIAKILSTVDEAIRSTRETISKLERVKKSLMQNLLSGKMKPDGTLRPAAEFYEDDKMGLVPKGWTVKAIGEMFDSHPTASYSRSKLFEQGNCKYIHYGDIHTKFDRFLDVSNTELPYISNDMIKRFVFLQDGDLVIADTSEDYDGVGKLVEIKNTNETKVIAGLHTLMIRSKTDDLINGYKGYLFNEYRVRLSMLKYVTGIKVYSISKSCLAKVLVSVPPVNEQIEIKNKLDSVSKQIQNKQEKITSLESLKKSLMQQLLTGRVRVK